MQTFDLRQAIIQRVQDKTNDQILEIIKGSIGHDEKALPGLGVLFEIIWNNLDEQLQHKLVSTLNDSLLDETRL